ncbi:Inactive hydroxysteroid dehydrogenase-like protein 1 [Galemys pyrenaicus]|uniref:Inactive hydroxysteroid dehydrogenase-like protein 1 n=1 Tax=Galemys pyrenaicus TaxID=202257 RepID=A0A8J6DM22_GALPY|nr:Inactive hydroxysteroid dehydrogenase-like protein 1 [Galemys pyrenaicus]
MRPALGTDPGACASHVGARPGGGSSDGRAGLAGVAPETALPLQIDLKRREGSISLKAQFGQTEAAMASVDSFYLLYREIARSCNCYIEALALVGAWYTARKSITVVCDFYSLIRLHFIPRLVSRADLIKQYGRWAVVSAVSMVTMKQLLLRVLEGAWGRGTGDSAVPSPVTV